MATSSQSGLPNLRTAVWLQKPETKAVFSALNQNGHVARAVGGAVRNTLIGTGVHDVDIATTAPPDITMRLALSAGLKAIPTGIDHGTVTVISAHVPFEVTTLRRDVETDGRHARIAFTDDWAADAGRRDFTLNALYCDADGTLHDPLGSGHADLVARRVRFIGDPADRIREDYLRILRFFRFTADYAEGALDVAGLAACRDLADGLQRLSRERVRAELLRLLTAAHAAPVVAAIAADFLPMILPDGNHPHLFARIAAIEAANGRTPDAIVRLGALSGARPGLAVKLQDALRLSSRELERLARLCIPDPALAPDAPEHQAKAFIYRHGADAYVDGLMLAWARSDVAPDSTSAQSRIRLPERWKAPALPIRGSDIMELGVPAGPRVGKILTTFEDWWIGAGFPDDPAQLATKLASLIDHRH